MTIQERYEQIINYFRQANPDAAPELHYSNPYELLVAVILSAQCTDKRVNMVTPAIFEAYPNAKALSTATFDELYPLVKSVSYPNSKTRHLISMAQNLVERFNGEVPHTPEELVTLPGVGRKTANVVSSVCFGAPVIAVDTHVFRVARRLGLSKGENVEKVERDLTRYIPEALRMKAHHWIILHGRYICTARKPYCEQCDLRMWCKGYEAGQKKEEK